MNARRASILVIAILVAASLSLPAQNPPRSTEQSAASPEMDRLAKALTGDWNTVERMEKSEFFPNGGGRHGKTHVYLAAGGTTLVDEVHSDGSAGRLDGFVVIWWDDSAKLYRFFTCFKDPKNACELRGTAHWEGDTFVNDYEITIAGKPTKSRDSFIHITPNSHDLVAAIDTGNGSWRTLITTTSTRR